MNIEARRGSRIVKIEDSAAKVEGGVEVGSGIAKSVGLSGP